MPIDAVGAQQEIVVDTFAVTAFADRVELGMCRAGLILRTRFDHVDVRSDLAGGGVRHLAPQTVAVR